MVKMRSDAGRTTAFGRLNPLPVGLRAHVYDYVYRVVRHAVITRSIPPGTPVVEATLADQLEVSRTPVRDALRRLEADGLLERTGGKSLVVANFSPDDVEDIFLVRATLDQAVARLLVQRTVASDWEPIRKGARALDAIAIKRGTGSFEFAAAHNEFHSAIYRLAFTPRVAEMVSERILALVEIAGELSYAEPPSDSSVASHLELVDALSSGGARRAVAAARAHCSDAFDAALAAEAGS